MMRLHENKVKVIIYEQGSPIKSVEMLYINASITDIGFNTIPKASVVIKGIDSNFSARLARGVNKLGIHQSLYTIEVYAWKANKAPFMIFQGNIVATDTFGAPDNDLTIQAVTGAFYMGQFSVFQIRKDSDVKDVIKDTYNNKVSKEGSTAPAPSVVVSSNLDVPKFDQGVFSGSMGELLTDIQRKKLNARYVWGTKNNELGLFSIEKVENSHVVNSQSIINNIELNNGISEVTIQGFFDEFAKIKIADGVRINSRIKSHANNEYQVMGMKIDVSNYEPSKWITSLKCRIIA